MYESNLWHTDMQEKSTLTIYRKYKHSIKDAQNLYDNSAGTTTLFEARTGTLQLNDKKDTQMEKPHVNYVVIFRKTLNIFFYIVLLYRKQERM